MLDNSKCRDNSEGAIRSTESAQGWSMSRRSLLSAGALLGMAALMRPTESAYAWSSWTNATSPILKQIGMGDCVHEDLVQISYARMLRNPAAAAQAALARARHDVPYDGRLLMPRPHLPHVLQKRKHPQELDSRVQQLQVAKLDDGSYLIAVRDMDSLATSIMTAPQARLA